MADTGAALMLVQFYRAGDEPQEPRGELVTVARDLAELYPDEWQALLAETTPARSELRKTGRKRPGRRRGRR